ncbi:MAG TPA: hypothetical protein V6C76_04980 [Drouetiella sp.]
MTFSDDYAPTFSNDNGGGDFLDSPDMVRQSPTTAERVVDTQSGFLVVVKRVDSRVSLSVKRRLGTPPASSILLTPDESVKLSRILASRNETRTSVRRSGINLPSLPSIPSSTPSSFQSELDNWTPSFDNFESTRRIPLEDDDDVHTPENSVSNDETDDTNPRSFRARRARSRSQRNSPSFQIPVKLIAGVIACLVIIPAIALGGYNMLTAKHTRKVEAAPAPAVDVEAVEAARVDKFARAFVADMLDFNPTTYRISQVHAMANMTPELMETYWNETHFPLSIEQLKASPKGMTLMITKVDQSRIDELTRTADIYAELVSPDNKLSNQVHLQLKIATSTDGQFRVLEQKDLSTKK